MTYSAIITLSNGIAMPELGLGTFSDPEKTSAAVKTALAAGYRLIDTASAYKNERKVGEVVRESGVDRADIFVSTKLWVSQYGYDETPIAFEASLDRLGFDYLDLYLLHWPVPASFDKTVAAWKAANTLMLEGRVRAIDVCNFTPAHIDRLIVETGVVPMLNQIELHPHFIQSDARAAHDARGIVTQSWSPLGGIFDWGAMPGLEKGQSPLPFLSLYRRWLAG